MQGSAKTVFLVSCVGKKRATPHAGAARDLYISNWFVKARDYVESTRCSWFILSAKYGLVSPTRRIRRYNQTLNTMKKVERRAWATRVRAQMKSCLPTANRIVVLAGRRYREFLLDYLRQHAKKVEVANGEAFDRQAAALPHKAIVPKTCAPREKLNKQST